MNELKLVLKRPFEELPTTYQKMVSFSYIIEARLNLEKDHSKQSNIPLPPKSPEYIQSNSPSTKRGKRFRTYSDVNKAIVSNVDNDNSNDLSPEFFIDIESLQG